MKAQRLMWLRVLLMPVILVAVIAALTWGALPGNATALQQDATPTPAEEATPTPAAETEDAAEATSETATPTPAAESEGDTQTEGDTETEEDAETEDGTETDGTQTEDAGVTKATATADANEAAAGEEATDEEATPEPTPSGVSLFTDYCAACHQAGGQGVDPAYPALAGNPFVTAEDPSRVLRVVFTGRAGMPHFRDAFSAEEIAAIVTYIRTSWGNDASAVDAETVRTVEEEIYSPSETMEHMGSSK